MYSRLFAVECVLAGLPIVSANFYIYYTPASDYETYMVFNNRPDCDDFRRRKSWIMLDDVSDDKQGIRCKGPAQACFGGDPGDIEELEMNFGGDEYHWSEWTRAVSHRTLVS